MNQLNKKIFFTRTKSVLFILIAFGLGLTIATGIAQMLEKTEPPDVAATVDSREVFIVKKDIRNGQAISPSDIIVTHHAKDRVPKGAVKTFQQIEGRLAKLDIPKDTILVDDYFVSRNVKNNNSAGFIPIGYHSVPVQVYESVLNESDENYAMTSGDHVDVIVVQTRQDDDETSEEFVLFQKIPVLNADWAEEENKTEKKGEVNLLLSDAQKKDLQAELNENTKIRLRICPPEPSKTAGESSQENQQHSSYLSQRDFAPKDQPLPLTQVVPSEEQMTIVFGDKIRKTTETPVATQASGKILKPANPNELHIATFRGIPEDSYTREYSSASQKPTLDNSDSPLTLSQGRTEPKYTSFYDSSGYRGQSDVQWQVTPRSPVVFESSVQRPAVSARGVYRDGGVYVSAE